MKNAHENAHIAAGRPAEWELRTEEQQAASGLIMRRLHAAPRPQEPSSDVPAVAETAVRTAVPRRRILGRDPRVDERIWPLRKHWGDGSWEENWSLYWLPLKFENKRDTEVEPRFMFLFDQLLALFSQGPKLSEYTFFDSQLLHPYLLRHFILHATQYFPLGAIGFRPEEGPCKIPDYDDAAKVNGHTIFQTLQEKKEGFGLGDMFPNAPPMLYSLLASQDMARRSLTGRGGYGYVLSKLNQEKFFAATKQMLARNTTDEILLKMPMVAPTLSSASFTRSSRADLEQWFSILDLYVQESPRDKGVIFASNRCLDDELGEFVIKAGLNRAGLRKRIGLSLLTARGETGR